MKREYWTYLDDSNNHYEISNFGRVRNAKTQRIMHPTWSEKRKMYEFGVRYKDTPYKKVNLKRAILNHFGSNLLKNEFVKIIDKNKPLTLDNLQIYTFADIEKIKKEKVYKKQNDETYLKIFRTCQIIVYKQWKQTCKSYGIDCEDLISEAMMNVLADYDNYKIEQNFFSFCRYRIKQAFSKLKNNELDIEDYVIGKNYEI